MLRADALTQRVVAPVCQCGRRLQCSDPDLECVGETVRNDDQALMNVEAAMAATADRTLPPQTFAARNDRKLGAIPLHHRGITLSRAPVLHARNIASHHRHNRLNEGPSPHLHTKSFRD